MPPLESIEAAPIPRQFYDAPPELVARKLIGKLLIRRFAGTLLSGIIVETEAYLAKDDPASHNYIGKTLRNAVLFGEAGHAYVHSMRQYHLIDVVTQGTDIPGSVLIRALQPLHGIEHMKIVRKTDDMYSLLSGPSKLCQAFGIDRSMNGMDLTSPVASVWIEDSTPNSDALSIQASQRIGIAKAADSVLRFYLADNPYVSKPR